MLTHSGLLIAHTSLFIVEEVCCLARTETRTTYAYAICAGIDVAPGKGLVLISDLIRAGLGGGVDVSVLMGANVADEVAEGQFCEATIGYHNPAAGALWRDVFDTITFRVSLCPDSSTVELCGALKNVVALGAG